MCVYLAWIRTLLLLVWHGPPTVSCLLLLLWQCCCCFCCWCHAFCLQAAVSVAVLVFASDALPPSPAMTTPQWWMIRPTYCVMFLLFLLLVPCFLLARCCFCCCSCLCCSKSSLSSVVVVVVFVFYSCCFSSCCFCCCCCSSCCSGCPCWCCCWCCDCCCCVAGASPLAAGLLVGFPGASLSVGSPWLARHSSVPRWFACRSPALAISAVDARRRPRPWQRRNGGWYCPPPPTVLLLLLLLLCLAVAVVAAVAGAAAMGAVLLLGSLVRRCRSGRPGWLGNPRCPNGSPAGVLLLRFLLSMLAAVRGHDNATTVDDTVHLQCYCCCCCLLLLASWLGSLVRRCRSGRSGWLGNPRCPDGSPAGVLLLQWYVVGCCSTQHNTHHAESLSSVVVVVVLVFFLPVVFVVVFSFVVVVAVVVVLLLLVVVLVAFVRAVVGAATVAAVWLVLLHLQLASWLGSLVRRCRSGRPGWLGNPRCPDGSPAGVLLLRFLLSMPSSAILPVTPATVRFPALCGDQWAARCGGLDSVSTLSSLPMARCDQPPALVLHALPFLGCLRRTSPGGYLAALCPSRSSWTAWASLPLLQPPRHETGAGHWGRQWKTGKYRRHKPIGGFADRPLLPRLPGSCFRGICSYVSYKLSYK